MRTAHIAFLLALPLAAQADLASAAPPIEQRNEKQAPSLFGTAALPISRTPLDRQWRAAFAASVPSHIGPWVPLLTQLQGASQLQQVKAVNKWVNQRVAFRSDSAAGSGRDVWSTATATLQRGTGDCEDYAIAKLQLLRALGIPGNAIYLMVGRDRALNADHALLVVRIGHEAWVLDNRTDAMPASEFPEFGPVLSFSGHRTWLHGYPSTPKPLISSSGTAIAAVKRH